MHGKKYTESLKQIDPKKVYSLEEAVDLAKKTSYAKFDATLELHLRLGIDVSKSEQSVRGSVALPYGSGKTKKVIAFVSPDKEKEAKDAGADIVGGEELVAQIALSKKCDFDVAVAMPEIMPKLAKIAKILGPKGLMPNPKLDTVGANVKKMVSEQKAGKVDFKNDAAGNVHVVFGKISHDNSKLVGNFQALISAIKKAKPSSSKGEFIKGAYISSTMGPSIKIAV